MRNSHESISIEQYNRELDEANIRIETGEYVSNDDVRNESESW